MTTTLCLSCFLDTFLPYGWSHCAFAILGLCAVGEFILLSLLLPVCCTVNSTPRPVHRDSVLVLSTVLDGVVFYRIIIFSNSLVIITLNIFIIVCIFASKAQLAHRCLRIDRNNIKIVRCTGAYRFRWKSDFEFQISTSWYLSVSNFKNNIFNSIIFIHTNSFVIVWQMASNKK